MFSSKPLTSIENNSQSSSLFGKDLTPISQDNTSINITGNESLLFKTLFSKSEELSKLGNEILDLPQSFEKRDQIRGKVYAYGGAHSNCHTSSNTNSLVSRDIKPFQGGSKNTKPKPGGVKLDFKSPFNEMKENIQCLEKLVEYQKCFCKANHTLFLN